MSEAQKKIADAIASGPARRRARPFHVLLRSPGLCAAPSRWRIPGFNCALEKPSIELATAMIARNWSQQ